MNNAITIALAFMLSLVLIATGYAVHLTTIRGTAQLEISFNQSVPFQQAYDAMPMQVNEADGIRVREPRKGR